MKHLIKIESTAHGVLGVRHAGLDQQYANAGDTIILEWQPDAKWGLEEAHYTDNDGNVTPIDLTTTKVDGKDVVVFTMPDTEIVVGGTFKRFVIEDWTADGATEGNLASIGAHGTIVDSGIAASNVATKDELEKDFYLSGAKEITENITAWSTKTLPFTIPTGTHVILSIVGDDTFKTWFFNYNTADAFVLNGVGDIEIFKTEIAISTIRTTQTGILKIKFVNDNFVYNIEDNTITPAKISGEHIQSPNLFDKDGVTEGYYVNYTNGNLAASTTLCASDYIEVKGGANYYSYPSTNQMAFYDENKNYISGAATGDLITVPNNAKYMRVSVYTANLDTQTINEGTSAIAYTPYYKKVKNLDIIASIDEDLLNNLNTLKPIVSRLWNGYESTTNESLTSGNTISLDDYPKSLKKGDKISFYAKITSWGNGITIGKGVTDYSACYAIIDATNLTLKLYPSGTETTISTVAHGLTFDTYVKIVIDISATKWKFIVQTLTDTFVTEITCSYGNGTPRVTSNGASLTSAVLSCTNSDFSKPIWMFGDSYFGIATNNRELYWLDQWGYLNVLVQGYAGQSSSGAYADLEKCFAISKPKYLVWCLGMNDNASLDAWKGYVTNVKSICDTYGVTLILGTIPKPISADYNYKDDMSAWIREESGCRYIDVAKAVGSNDQGQWYGYGETFDYQSNDNVHPSMYGAKAISTQFLIDFPEIMQY